MDYGGILLDYPYMSIPIYGLYGELDERGGVDWLHWETIQTRSRLHGYRIAPHRHEQFFQVLHLTGGSMDVTVDGAVHTAKASSLVILPAMSVHGFHFTHDVEGTVLTFMQRDVDGCGIGEFGTAVLPTEPGCADAIARMIAEADLPGVAHEPAMRALLTLLLVSLRRAWQHSMPIETRGGRGHAHAMAFRSMVDKRFRETRSIVDYAAALGISPNHLNRVSREVLGASALAVIERRIVLEARRNLLFSDRPIKQIGAELGYDDPAYFTRFLTRALGVPPRQLRLGKTTTADDRSRLLRLRIPDPPTG